jgi:hypothetical protein
MNKNSPPQKIAPRSDTEPIHWKEAFDLARNFNDRSLHTIAWIGGTIVTILVASAAFLSFNLNNEKERVDRAISSMDGRFDKLAAELKGARNESPKIEIALTSDKRPIADRSIPYEIYSDDFKKGKPYRLKLMYSLKNVGKGSAGRIWIKTYFEPKDLFEGDHEPDEKGYGIEAISSPNAWVGSYTGTSGDFPGAGFSTNVSAENTILADRIPKGKYKVMLKVYYGSSATNVESTKTYFEVKEDWIRPKSQSSITK